MNTCAQVFIGRLDPTEIMLRTGITMDDRTHRLDPQPALLAKRIAAKIGIKSSIPFNLECPWHHQEPHWPWKGSMTSKEVYRRYRQGRLQSVPPRPFITFKGKRIYVTRTLYEWCLLHRPLDVSERVQRAFGCRDLYCVNPYHHTVVKVKPPRNTEAGQAIEDLIELLDVDRALGRKYNPEKFIDFTEEQLAQALKSRKVLSTWSAK